MRSRSEVISDWANELSEKLGRPAEEIRNRGLSVYDFQTSHRVRINFEDESFAEFRYAFCLRKDKDRVLAVFTEHCGYLEFPLNAVAEVIELPQG